MRKREGTAAKVFGNWSASHERAWEREHLDKLASKARRAMTRWARTLTQEIRRQLDERTRRERVRDDISEERSRRTVQKTVATGTNKALPRGSITMQTAGRKVEAGWTAEFSSVASCHQLNGRERLRPSTSRPTATVGSD